MPDSVSDTPEPWAPEAAVVARTEAPVTRAAMVAALRAAGVQDGGVIIVHSSLSRLGWVVGGAHTAVLALMDAVGPTGTIVMPALSSHLSEPSGWVAPPVPEAWWQIIRDEMPAYDAVLTPMVAMGAVAEGFRLLPGTVRSSHPADSFMANGPLADDVLAPHLLELHRHRAVATEPRLRRPTTHTAIRHRWWPSRQWPRGNCRRCRGSS